MYNCAPSNDVYQSTSSSSNISEVRGQTSVTESREARFAQSESVTEILVRGTKVTGKMVRPDHFP